MTRVASRSRFGRGHARAKDETVARAVPASWSSAVHLAAGRHPLTAAVGRRLERSCGVPRGSAVAVGVSGGADSVALLLACSALASRRPDGLVRPVAVHIHHHLRGATADEDAAQVTDLCRRLGVELHVRHIWPSRLAGNTAGNARALRHLALERAAQTIDAACVALAHHADDQLETMLMALLRGCGMDGLRGMAWRRPLPGGIALVRPLLAARKGDCESLCDAAGVAWREDPTNADPRTARGRLRRDVMPVLETLWPDAARRAAGTAESLATACAVLEREVAAVFGDAARRSWPRARLAALPAPMLALGLRRAALDARPEAGDALGQRHLAPAFELIGSADASPKRLDWPARLCLEVDCREVRLCPRE